MASTYGFSPGGIFNELDFLTHIPVLDNVGNKDSIFNQIYGQSSYDANGNRIDNLNSSSELSLNFKSGAGKSDTQSIKNYYKETVYRDNESDLNQYLRLIRDFEATGYESCRFQAADFAYLKDLGVYPLNRMWVLRRFSPFTVVPDHLLDWEFPSGKGVNPLAVSTLVGWIPPGQDQEFFSIEFNEKWEKIEKRIDQILMDIMDKEFGFQAQSVVSLPGWSQGILFAFLNQMGLTDYGLENIPQGNPNVLMEAATRASDSEPKFGLESSLSITLKSEYEQKFIGDIDPGSAMLDILNRIIYMGTSETEYMFSTGNANSQTGVNILGSLREAAASGTDVNKWWTFIVNVVQAFIKAIDSMITGFIEAGNPFERAPENTDDTDDDTDDSGDGDKGTSGEAAAARAATDQLSNLIGSVANGLIQTILASTVAKWRWALVGSISVMDGSNSTPWHLTLGNPYSPFVSFGNVKIDRVKLSTNNEFGFNDMPTRIKVEITVSLGRNLGAQEIFRMFNNGYARVYTKDKKPASQQYQNTVNSFGLTGGTENQGTLPPTGDVAQGALSGPSSTASSNTTNASSETGETQTVTDNKNPVITTGEGNPSSSTTTNTSTTPSGG